MIGEIDAWDWSSPAGWGFTLPITLGLLVLLYRLSLGKHDVMSKAEIAVEYASLVVAFHTGVALDLILKFTLHAPGEVSGIATFAPLAVWFWVVPRLRRRRHPEVSLLGGAR